MYDDVWRAKLVKAGRVDIENEDIEVAEIKIKEIAKNKVNSNSPESIVKLDVSLGIVNFRICRINEEMISVGQYDQIYEDKDLNKNWGKG